MPLEPALVSALAAAATNAASRAYAPYSNFPVGAALLFENGTITTGVNVENASYGLSSCAERNALFRAVSEQGPLLKIIAVAVFHKGAEACPPCGACRQVISEFASDTCTIYYSCADQWRNASLDELLPARFNRRSL